MSRVSDITDLDRVGLPVFVAVRPDAHPRNLTVSAGKGTDGVASLVSCLAEAYERHWAEPRHHPLRRTSAADLEAAGERWLSPHDCGTLTGAAWTPTTELDWIELQDLGTRSGPVLVPAQYAVVPYVSADAPLTASSSDGVAAGNTFEEAALHGLMELVERDACSFGVWMHTGHRVPTDTLPVTALDVVDRLRAADLDVRVYQFDALLGVPVVYVTLDDLRSTSAMLLCAGAGAHVDGEIALTRALTEAAQSCVCAISGGREDLAPKYLDNRTLGYDQARRSLEVWDRHFDDAPFRRWGAVTALGSPDEALDAVVAGLVEHGFDRVLVRELTPPGAPLSVARTLVPGLESVEGPQSPAGHRFREAMLRHVRAGVSARSGGAAR